MATKKRVIAKTRREALAARISLYEGKPCKYGHGVIRVTNGGACYECARILTKEYHKRMYPQQRDQYIARAAKWAAINPEKKKAFNDKVRAKRRDAHNAYNRQWFSENKALRSHYEQKRRASKLQASVPGYEAELRRIYELCPEGFTVDHIVPLKGRTVCGLHVPWNLRYITLSENSQKNATFIESLALDPNAHVRH